MLKAITLENFKSYRSARLPLSPLTVLIGANASGKSNAIEAMRLLSWLAQGQKLSTIRYNVQSENRLLRGKIEDLPYFEKDSFSFGCETDYDSWNQLSMAISLREDELHITKEILSGSSEKNPLYYLHQPSSGFGTDVSVAYDFSERDRIPLVHCSDQMAIFTQLTSPATFEVHRTKSQEIIPQVVKKYEKWLSSMLFLDPVPSKMRDYSFQSEKQLLGDGSNLSGTLYNLWNGKQKLKNELQAEQNQKDILNFIQNLPEQDISALGFIKEPRGGVMVKLTETFGGQQRDYDASLLSDGTLRVLAIAAAMLSAKEDSLVVIEEIDNGVHPSRAHHLLEQIRSIATRRNLRVLITTHNPALLDSLPDSAVPEVVFCYRDPKDGSSRLVRLADVPDYPELTAQGSLGHLVTTGILERFVKQEHNEEARKQKALAWLENLRKGGEE